MRRALFGLVLAAFLGSAVAPAGATNVHYPYGPEYRHCGELGNSSIYVSADGLTCTHARLIISEFRFAPRDRVHHHGPENYTGWWTLERYPGWKCHEGTGGGGCEKGSQQAAFSTL
ncbi:MAG: hypothetical protein JSS68_14355 [Actinobacteria bacterium]|nr:hypothetical protein [Actinomycetota bacterium]